MSKTSPIIIVENDLTDQETYQNILRSLEIKNSVHFFDNGRDALEYIKTTRDNPFIILSEIKLPIMDGLEFRKEIAANPYLRKKGTPFVFVTHSSATPQIKQAFELFVQGYFIKPSDLSMFKDQLNNILYYWKGSLVPPVMEMKSDNSK